MPIAVIPAKLSRPEDLVEYLADLFSKSELPFNYIAKYDENLIPKYPALHIQAAPFDKTLKATHTFLVALRASIHILHANMMEDRQTRNYEDLVLATQVVTLLESDMTLEGKVIHGWVESEVPGVLPPRVTKGEAIVSTRLNWIGIQERRFN